MHYACMHVYMYVCMYIYIFLDVFVYVRMYIYFLYVRMFILCMYVVLYRYVWRLHVWILAHCVCVCSYTLNVNNIEKLTGSETRNASNCWICFSGNYSKTVTNIRQFYTSYKLECFVPSSYSIFCTDAVNWNTSI